MSNIIYIWSKSYYKLTKNSNATTNNFYKLINDLDIVTNGSNNWSKSHKNVSNEC